MNMSTKEQQVVTELMRAIDKRGSLPRCWLSKDLQGVADRMAKKGMLVKGEFADPDSPATRLVCFSPAGSEMGEMLARLF